MLQQLDLTAIINHSTESSSDHLLLRQVEIFLLRSKVGKLSLISKNRWIDAARPGFFQAV